MLPKLVRHGPPARVPGTAGAAARLEAAEAAALAAVRMAASMAAAAGLPYRPPDGVALDGLEGIVQVRQGGAGSARFENGVGAAACTQAEGSLSHQSIPASSPLVLAGRPL